MAFGDIIQRAKGTNGTGTTTAQASFVSVPTQGNLLVAIHMTGAADSAGVSNGTNAYTLGLECANTTEGDWCGAYFRIAGASEPQTVTATSVASDENALLLLEIEGPFAAVPVDVAFDEGRHAAAVSYAIGPSPSTAQASEIAVALCYTRASTNNVIGNQSWSDGFVKHDDSLIASSFKSIAAATKLLSAAAAISTTYTYPNSTVAHGGVITFKAAGAATLTATPGTLTLAGANATLTSSGESVDAQPGDLTLTGQAASVVIELETSPGALTLAGAAAAFAHDFAADAGAMALTGGNAVLDAGASETLTAEPGALSLTGGTLLFDLSFRVEAGQLTLVGGMAGFDLSLAANAALLTLTGADVTLTQTGETALSALPGELVLTGAEALFEHALTALPGSIGLSGAEVLFGLALDAQSALMTLNGANASLTATSETALSAAPGTLSITGAAASFGRKAIGRIFVVEPENRTFIVAGRNRTFEA